MSSPEWLQAKSKPTHSLQATAFLSTADQGNIIRFGGGFLFFSQE